MCLVSLWFQVFQNADTLEGLVMNFVFVGISDGLLGFGSTSGLCWFVGV